jgi:hypothetical protein
MKRVTSVSGPYHSIMLVIVAKEGDKRTLTRVGTGKMVIVENTVHVKWQARAKMAEVSLIADLTTLTAEKAKPRP